MKVLILGLVVAVGAGAFVAGQTTPSALTRVVYGPDTDVRADKITHDEETRTTYARGAVRIVTESSTITADEADLHHLRATREAVDLDIVLRGNVRVVIAPLNGGLRSVRSKDAAARQ